MKKLNIQYSHFPTSFIYICSSFLQKTALKSSFSNSFCARRRLWIFCSRQIPCCCSPCPLPFLNINRMNQEKNAVTTAIQTDHPSYSQINNFLEYIWISLLCIKLLQNHHQCHPFQFFHGMLFSCPPPPHVYYLRHEHYIWYHKGSREVSIFICSWIPKLLPLEMKRSTLDLCLWLHLLWKQNCIREA